MGSPTPPGAPHLRPRSMAAVVVSRASAGTPAEAAGTTPATDDAAAPRRWPTIVLWIVLGAAIAAAWALLLLGDSLQSVSG